MRISVLDAQRVDALPDLLPVLDTLGFHRYWTTEHQSAHQSSSASIVVGLAAGLTQHMRIGSGGVLLRTTSALRVAHDFAVLNLFFPGRIDLGVAGAVSVGEYRDELERDVRIADDSAYAERLSRLVSMVTTGVVTRGAAPIGPRAYRTPEVWVCGTSTRSARLAGALGASFAYHHHLMPRDPVSARDISDAYLSAFSKSGSDRPALAIAAYGACGTSRRDSVATWNATLGPDAGSPSFAGSAADVVEQLAALTASYRADEIFIDCYAPTVSERLDALASITHVALGPRSVCPDAPSRSGAVDET